MSPPIEPPPAEMPPEVAVRETACKTLLNPSSLGDYSLNCYTGCTHACAYCYARFMQQFHPHPEPWGRFVDVKINAVEVLVRQLRRVAPGEVFVSSACDAWQPVEAQYRLTRRCCELLIERGFQVNALSKSTLVLRDLDVLSRGKARVGVTITTLDERLRALWEPHAAPVESRFGVLAAASAAGLPTAIMFGPLLPLLSDDGDSLAAMFRRAKELDVGTIWVDALNLRPRVWPALDALLRRQFPSLRERYRRVLFNAQGREQYLGELRARVTLAARWAGLAERVSVCF